MGDVLKTIQGVSLGFPGLHNNSSISTGALPFCSSRLSLADPLFKDGCKLLSVRDLLSRFIADIKPGTRCYPRTSHNMD